MPPRSIGTLTKIVVENHFAVAQIELGSDESDDLGEAIAPDIDGEATTVVDDWLILHQRGANGERPEAETVPIESTVEEPLEVDIDDGRPGMPARMGALRRVRYGHSFFSKIQQV